MIFAGCYGYCGDLVTAPIQQLFQRPLLGFQEVDRAPMYRMKGCASIPLPFILKYVCTDGSYAIHALFLLHKH